ncbi:MAG TPA: hypothetical protein DCF45_11990 [Gammaproteobacteria bacterium]|nr:hypothetical protein [Gammaproteobacteria bacterium]
MKKTISALALAGTTAVSFPSLAAPLGFWATDGWTQFASEDQTTNFLDPGYGGQNFDAEYLYYKRSGNILSVGLQTGFDVLDGHQKYTDGKHYYTGDLALSFDNHVTSGAGAGSTYEYGIDFGLMTRGFSGKDHGPGSSSTAGLIDMGSGTGIDAAGLYSVSSWSNDIISGHHVSDPFAMDGGSLVASLLSNDAGFDGESFYRTVSFDLTALGIGSELGIDVHWTMSCGNDAIDGHFDEVSVSEPAAMSLLGLGLLGLVRRRKFS